MICLKYAFFMAYLIIRAMSYAVVTLFCPESDVSPLALKKDVLSHPIAAAFSFIFLTKDSIDPPTASARTFAASFAD